MYLNLGKKDNKFTLHCKYFMASGALYFRVPDTKSESQLLREIIPILHPLTPLPGRGGGDFFYLDFFWAKINLL